MSRIHSLRIPLITSSTTIHKRVHRGESNKSEKKKTVLSKGEAKSLKSTQRLTIPNIVYTQ